MFVVPSLSTLRFGRVLFSSLTGYSLNTVGAMGCSPQWKPSGSNPGALQTKGWPLVPLREPMQRNLPRRGHQMSEPSSGNRFSSYVLSRVCRDSHLRLGFQPVRHVVSFGTTLIQINKVGPLRHLVVYSHWVRVRRRCQLLCVGRPLTLKKVLLFHGLRIGREPGRTLYGVHPTGDFLSDGTPGREA